MKVKRIVFYCIFFGRERLPEKKFSKYMVELYGLFLVCQVTVLRQSRDSLETVSRACCTTDTLKSKIIRN